MFSCRKPKYVYGHDAETITSAEEDLRYSSGKHSLNSALFTTLLLLLCVSDIGAPNGQPFSTRWAERMLSILGKHEGTELTVEVQTVKTYTYVLKFLFFFILH